MLTSSSKLEAFAKFSPYVYKMFIWGMLQIICLHLSGSSKRWITNSQPLGCTCRTWFHLLPHSEFSRSVQFSDRVNITILHSKQGWWFYDFEVWWFVYIKFCKISGSKKQVAQISLYFEVPAHQVSQIVSQSQHWSWICRFIYLLCVLPVVIMLSTSWEDLQGCVFNAWWEKSDCDESPMKHQVSPNNLRMPGMLDRIANMSWAPDATDSYHMPAMQECIHIWLLYDFVWLWFIWLNSQLLKIFLMACSRTGMDGLILNPLPTVIVQPQGDGGESSETWPRWDTVHENLKFPFATKLCSSHLNIFKCVYAFSTWS